MNPILQSALGSIIRYFLIIVAAFLVKKGIWTQSAMEGYVEAAVVGILTLLWMIWTHYKNRIKFLTALMPGPKTEAEVDNHISSGAATPDVSTPKNTIPVPKP